MMFWSGKKRRVLDQNRGDGRFIDNINWWFWNGKKLPGLLTRDQFSNIRLRALSTEENSELAGLLISDSIITNGHKPNRSPRFLSLLKKVSDYLEELSTDDPDSTLLEFSKKPADTLRAYLNVLEFWGYGYSWQNLNSLRGQQTTLIKKDNNPLVVVGFDEIQYILGRPFRFEVIFKGLSWHFNEGQSSFRVLQRDCSNDRLEVRESWL